VAPGRSLAGSVYERRRSQTEGKTVENPVCWETTRTIGGKVFRSVVEPLGRLPPANASSKGGTLWV